jgi:hypothetical protein
MSQIPVEKNILSRDFRKVIDTDFHQLLNNNQNLAPEIGIDEFFELYEQLFYQIPKEGETNSHRYILTRTVQYLGVKLAEDIDVNALLEEITSLRQQLLEADKDLQQLKEDPGTNLLDQ